LAARIGVEVDTLEVATTAEIRSLLLGEPIDIPAVEARSEEQKETETEQGDTHSTVTLRQREIELLKLR
jgi:hypothetical protein